MTDRASAQASQKLFLSLDPEIVYKRSLTKRMGGIIDLPEVQANIISNARESLNFLNAQTVPATFLQGAAQLQIFVPQSATYLKHLRVEFTVTNNDAGINTLLPVPLWFSSVQISGNAGNVVLQQWTTGPGLLLDQVMNRTEENLISIADVENIDPHNPGNIGPAATLTAGQTQTFYLGFTTAFWENFPLWLGTMNGPLVITLNSNPLSCFDVGSTGTNVTLTNCRAICTVVNPSDDQLKYLGQHQDRCFQTVIQQVTSQTMSVAANGQYNIRMSANTGLCPYLMVTTRGPVPFANKGLIRDWPDITSTFAILDASGSPIVQTVSERFASSFLASDYWQSAVFAEIGGVTQFSFSPSPDFVQKAGVIQGGVRFTGNEQYQFTAEASGFTPGQYEINVITAVYQIIRLDGQGQFSVYSS